MERKIEREEMEGKNREGMEGKIERRKWKEK